MIGQRDVITIRNLLSNDLTGKAILGTYRTISFIKSAGKTVELLLSLRYPRKLKNRPYRRPVSQLNSLHIPMGLLPTQSDQTECTDQSYSLFYRSIPEQDLSMADYNIFESFY